jgi:hypothetical protein
LELIAFFGLIKERKVINEDAENLRTTDTHTLPLNLVQVLEESNISPLAPEFERNGIEI